MLMLLLSCRRRPLRYHIVRSSGRPVVRSFGCRGFQSSAMLPYHASCVVEHIDANAKCRGRSRAEKQAKPSLVVRCRPMPSAGKDEKPLPSSQNNPEPGPRCKLPFPLQKEKEKEKKRRKRGFAKQTRKKKRNNEHAHVIPPLSANCFLWVNQPSCVLLFVFIFILPSILCRVVSLNTAAPHTERNRPLPRKRTLKMMCGLCHAILPRS